MAILAYNIEVEELSDDALVVTKFDGQESLSASLFGHRPCYGFCCQVVVRAVELRMYRNQLLVQRLHGVVRAFTQGDIGHHYPFYSLTLVPALERPSLRRNSRIFKHQTTRDIIAILFQEIGINDYALSLESGNEKVGSSFVAIDRSRVAIDGANSLTKSGGSHEL